MKRIFSLTLTFVLLMTLVTRIEALVAPLSSGHNLVYKTGLIWDSWETIEEKLREDSPLETALPSSVSLKDMFPTPRNQGQQNSCVPWAVAYALKSQQEETKRNWGLHTDEHLFSPSYVYNQINGGINRGMLISEAMDLLVNQGVSTLSSFPYNSSDYLTQPTAEHRAEAALYKVKDWYSIRGIDNMKKRLADGDGVVIGVPIYPDFDNISSSNPIYDVISGASRGNHAVCLIGYDDDKRAFKFINSWGTGWGLDGYGWISYDLLNHKIINHYGVAVGYVMESPIVYESNYYYTVSDDEAAITHYIGPGGNIVIPDTLGGYSVTSIGDWAFWDYISLTGVIIPDSVTSIGNRAFAGCTSLTDVVIGRVISIGDHAFEYCKSLTDIVIPDSVTSIGHWAFSGTSLTNVTIPDSVTSIGLWAFSGTSLTNVTIPDSVTSIGGNAFSYCNSLTNVVIGNGVTSIGNSAFLNLPNNAKIYVPDQTIKKLVANSGFPINRIIIFVDSGACGDDLTWELGIEGILTISGTGDMWDYTSSDAPWYSHRDSIKNVVIDNGVTSIGTGAFDDCEIETLIIDIPIIGTTFAAMSTLKTVTIGNNITSIAANAFSGLHDGAIIYVPNQTIKALVADSGFPEDRILDIIGSGTCGDDLMWELNSVGTLTISGTGDMWDGFNAPWRSHYDSITEVVIDNGVTSISDWAFAYCRSLTDVTIPDSVTSIGWFAFSGCTSLTGVTIPARVTNIGILAFDSIPNLTIYCYENSYAHEYAIENEIPVVIKLKYQLGDCNNDGRIDIADLTYLKRVLVDNPNFENRPECWLTPESKENKQPSAADLAALKMYLSGRRNNFPVEEKQD